MSTNDSGSLGNCGSQATDRIAPHLRLRYQLRNYITGKIMTFWRCHLYRHVMRLAHRFNWHYAPPQHPWLSKRPGETTYRCDWCGIGGTVYRGNKIHTLEQGIAAADPKFHKEQA